MEEKMTYESAYAELADIAADIENETISVDELAAKVKRAAVLISFCQEKLRNTETEVSKIISELTN